MNFGVILSHTGLPVHIIVIILCDTVGWQTVHPASILILAVLAIRNSQHWCWRILVACYAYTTAGLFLTSSGSWLLYCNVSSIQPLTAMIQLKQNDSNECYCYYYYYYYYYYCYVKSVLQLDHWSQSVPRSVWFGRVQNTVLPSYGCTDVLWWYTQVSSGSSWITECCTLLLLVAFSQWWHINHWLWFVPRIHLASNPWLVVPCKCEGRVHCGVSCDDAGRLQRRRHLSSV